MASNTIIFKIDSANCSGIIDKAHEILLTIEQLKNELKELGLHVHVTISDESAKSFTETLEKSIEIKYLKP